MSAEWAAVVVAAIIGAATVVVAWISTRQQLAHAERQALLDVKRNVYVRLGRTVTAIRLLFLPERREHAQSEARALLADLEALQMEIRMADAPAILLDVAARAEEASWDLVQFATSGGLPEGLAVDLMLLSQLIFAIGTDDLEGRRTTITDPDEFHSMMERVKARHAALSGTR